MRLSGICSRLFPIISLRCKSVQQVAQLQVPADRIALRSAGGAAATTRTRDRLNGCLVACSCHNMNTKWLSGGMQVPTDRIALRVLHGEMVNWPFLETDAAAATPAKIEIKAPVPGAL